MTDTGHVANPRFFTRTGPHKLSALAEAAACRPPAHEAMVAGLACLSLAEPDEITFVSGRRNLAALAKTRAGAILVPADLLESVPQSTIPLVTTDPIAGWATIAALFHPMPTVHPGTHPSAVISPTARIDPTAEIGPFVVIENEAEIGPGCKIGPGAVIGAGVVMGPDCRIGPHVSISHAILGARIYIYPGARIGQEGFGFSITPRGFQSKPQLGCVIIGDDVEVGANTTIDRGALTDTVIGAGTRLDNQVQVGHGVRIGRHCAIAGMVGFSGSVELGDFVEVGGQACFVEHVRVGPKSQISAQALVISDLEPGATVFGSPARNAHDAFRELATLKKLARRT